MNNKFVTSVISIILSLVIGYILYDNMIVRNEAKLKSLKGYTAGNGTAGRNIEGEEEAIIKEYADLQKKKNEIEALNKKLDANPKEKALYIRKLLSPGFSEANIISRILAAQPKKDENKRIYFKILDLNMGATFFYDNDESEMSQTNGNNGGSLELVPERSKALSEDEKSKRQKELLELAKKTDAQGNVQGIEVDDGTWKGVEIVPMTLKFEGTYKGFLLFMENLEKFPYHFIRSLDTIFSDDSNITGTLVLSFPLNDKKL